MVRTRAHGVPVSRAAQVMVTWQLSVAMTLVASRLQTGMFAGLQPRFWLAGHLVNTGPAVSTNCTRVSQAFVVGPGLMIWTCKPFVQHENVLTITVVSLSGPSMTAHGPALVIVHLIVAPGGGVTASW